MLPSMESLTAATAFNSCQHSDSHVIYALQTVEDIDGNQRSLSEFANKVAVVVNVASQCGFTDSNYKGLQFLYDKYKDYDFTVCPRHARV